MTIETTGESNEIESLLELLEPYGIIEVMRTWRVAVLKSKEWKDKLWNYFMKKI